MPECTIINIVQKWVRHSFARRGIIDQKDSLARWGRKAQIMIQVMIPSQKG